MSAEQQVRDFVRVGVRAGLLSTEDLHAEVVETIAAELPRRDADELATAWLEEARDRLRLDQQGWPDATDYERLQSAFDELEILDVVVLQGCEDHWVAKRTLDERAHAGSTPAGVAWFTPSDVWHAVDEGRIEVDAHWHKRVGP